MELSHRHEGYHTTASPSGTLLATVKNTSLRVYYVQHTERLYGDYAVKTAAKDVTALKWSSDSTRVAIISDALIEVQNIDAHGRPTRIENGTGSLGRFVGLDFLGDDKLLTFWGFGRAKVWNLNTGKGLDLGDLKTASHELPWQQRPISGSQVRALALLVRQAAEDALVLHFPELGTSMQSIKLPTSDAQSISWSPDGRWLAVLDTPTATPSVHFYTPNAHHYRSYTSTISDASVEGLGIKALTWSLDPRILALSRYDGKIVLLNTVTFAPLAIIEHTTTVDQSTLPSQQQAPIWREAVSASNERSYSPAAQPVSPSLSRTRTESAEIGVAEMSFSLCGDYLATRDERMLSTVWIWNIATLAADAVVMQHNNVRRIHWHPTRATLAVLDCGEGIAYLYDVAKRSAPVPVNVPLPGSPILSWLHTTVESKLAIVAATKSSVRILYPEGRESLHDSTEERGDAFDEGASEDSLVEILSGRRQMPLQKIAQSYTELLALDVDKADQTLTGQLDDTFRDKIRTATEERDPLDDSQIF